MNIFELTNKYLNQGKQMVIVSVVSKEGNGPATVGQKMLILPGNEGYGTVGGGALEFTAREYCKNILDTKKSETKTYLLNENKVLKDTTSLPMACGGKVTLFYEYLGPKEFIYIFGAGHVGQALVNVLSTLNYHITVIDERQEIIDQFIGGDEVECIPFKDYITKYGIKEDSYVIACTPSHTYDYVVMDQILEKELRPKYFGMLCSKKKLKEYIDKVYETHGKDINLENFYAPVGLNIGGGSPEEIAISITAEILAHSYNKPNQSHMRHTNYETHHYFKKG